MKTCEICGGQHVKAGERCENCYGCVKLCERVDGCSFLNEKPPIEIKEERKDNIKTNIAIPKTLKIEDTIRCWIISTLFDKFNDLDIVNEDNISKMAKDFIEIMEEKLSLADSKFRYFRISKNITEELDCNNLFINQNNDYVIIDKHKRTNLGKKIAVMEREEDD